MFFWICELSISVSERSIFIVLIALYIEFQLKKEIYAISW